MKSDRNQMLMGAFLASSIAFLSACGGSGGGGSENDPEPALLFEPAIDMQQVMNQGGYNSIEGGRDWFLYLDSVNLHPDNRNRILVSDNRYDFDSGEWTDRGNGPQLKVLMPSNGSWVVRDAPNGDVNVSFSNSGAAVFDVFGTEMVIAASEFVDLDNKPFANFISEDLAEILDGNERFSSGAQAYVLDSYYRDSAIIVVYSSSCDSGPDVIIDIDEGFSEQGVQVDKMALSASNSAEECTYSASLPDAYGPNDYPSFSEFQAGFPYGGDNYFEADLSVIAQFISADELALFNWDREELAVRGKVNRITVEGVEFLELLIPDEANDDPGYTYLLAVYDGQVVRAERIEANVIQTLEEERNRYSFNDQAIRDLLQDYPAPPSL